MSADDYTYRDFQCFIGDDFAKYVQIVDDESGEVIQDYTGWTFFMQVRSAYGSDELIADLSLGDGIGVVTIGDDEFIKIAIAKEDTASVDVSLPGPRGRRIPEVSAVYDFVPVDADGNVRTGLAGKFTFLCRVTEIS